MYESVLQGAGWNILVSGPMPIAEVLKVQSKFKKMISWHQMIGWTTLSHGTRSNGPIYKTECRSFSRAYQAMEEHSCTLFVRVPP